ncbi:MAG: hypothetical protein AAB019_03455 [Planctomycetota bacterium]
MNTKQSESGSILIVTIFIMMILIGFGVGYLAMTSAQFKQTESSITYQTSLESAWAGLEMAKVTMVNGHDTTIQPWTPTGSVAGALGWDDELQASNTNESTLDLTATPINIGTDTSQFRLVRLINYHGTSFGVWMTDNNDGDGNLLNDSDDLVILDIPAGLMQPVITDPTVDIQHKFHSLFEAIVQYKPPLYEPHNAVVTGGSLQISGNANINGQNGNVYVNGNLTVTNNAIVEDTAYATGTVTVNSPATVGSRQPNSPTFDVPPITPSDYASFADYTLKSDGKIYDQFGVEYAGALGWAFSNGQWDYNSNDAYNYTFYIQVDDPMANKAATAISGSPNNWQVTLISNGSIKVTGTPTMTPKQPGTLMIAGGDISIKGGVSNTFNGVIATHEQIELLGTPNITGSILAEDAVDTHDVVSTGSTFDLSLSGTTNITFNGAVTTILDAGDPYIKIMGIKKIK